MLLSKEVEVTINHSNYKYYLEKGYTFPMKLNYRKKPTAIEGSKIIVKVEDLPISSGIEIKCTCDFCGKELVNKYGTYNNQMKKNGFIRCTSCALIQRGERERKERILNGQNFENECKENDLLEWVENWDYEKNEDTPKTLSTSLYEYRYFKCSKGIHDSFSKGIVPIIRTKQIYKCPYCNSLGQWMLDNLGNDSIEKYWSNKNEKSPFEYSAMTKDKAFFKCTETNYHDDYFSIIGNFVKNKTRCPQCTNAQGNFHVKDSFGAYLEENNLFHLWSDKNEINPYEIYKKSATVKVLMKCGETDYHEDYLAIPNTFLKGVRCLYCARKLIHPKDSFGQFLIDEYGEDGINMYWDNEKNMCNPFEISTGSKKEIFIKCQNHDFHESYRTSPDGFSSGNRCPICKESRGERIIRDYIIKNNIQFEPQKTFSELKGIGGRTLSYDFYLPSYNLLIEYQGEYHYMPVYYKNETKEYCDNKFAKQQEHDKRKREYAQSHNITLLEIPYWDYDNVESILAEALHIDIDNDNANSTNSTNTNNIINNNLINTYSKSSSDNIYAKVKANKEEFDFPTVEEIMKM